MTKGDKIKLRAELAGKAMIGWLSNSEMLDAVHDHNASPDQFMKILAGASVQSADALMAELGIRMEDDK